MCFSLQQLTKTLETKSPTGRLEMVETHMDSQEGDKLENNLGDDDFLCPCSSSQRQPTLFLDDDDDG